MDIGISFAAYTSIYSHIVPLHITQSKTKNDISTDNSAYNFFLCQNWIILVKLYNICMISVLLAYYCIISLLLANNTIIYQINGEKA